MDDDTNIFVEDECEQDNPMKYEEINKILVEFDTPCLDWSKEDNMIRIKFLHLIDDHDLANKSIPKKVKYYK